MYINRKLFLQLSLEEIYDLIYTPMIEGRIETPLGISGKFFMKYLRNLGKVERYFVKGERTGYRFTPTPPTKEDLPYDTLYTLMVIYKKSIINSGYKYSPTSYGELFLNLLAQGYSLDTLLTMFDIERTIEEREI